MNGVESGPLAGWVIAISQGKTFVGRPELVTDAGYLVVLSPAYELLTMMQMVQQDPRRPPQMMTLRQVMPLLTYPSLKRVEVRQAVVIHVSELSSKERRELAQSVEACEQLMGAMRAQESGLVLPPPGTKLPEHRQ